MTNDDSSKNMPCGQAWQFDPLRLCPAAESIFSSTKPEGHATHWTAPRLSSLENIPGGQGAQLSAEFAFLYLPGAHASHRPSSRVDPPPPVADVDDAELYPYPGGQLVVLMLMHTQGLQDRNESPLSIMPSAGSVAKLRNPYPGRHHESCVVRLADENLHSSTTSLYELLLKLLLMLLIPAGHSDKGHPTKSWSIQYGWFNDSSVLSPAHAVLPGHVSNCSLLWVIMLGLCSYS